jgi:drug/metabolite transporter (DMT)-like permease
MPGKSKSLPYAAAVLAAVVWGFSFLFTKNALGYLRPFQLLGYRFLVAAAAMTLLVATRAVRVRLTRAKLGGLLLVALLQPVLYFTGETLGVARTTVSESGVVIALVPVAITLCSVLLLRERLSPAKWGAVALCAGGVVLIVLSEGWDAGSGRERLLGVLALLGAVAAAGFYNPLSRKVSEACSPTEVTFVMMWVGAIVFNAIGLGDAAVRGELGGYFARFADLHVAAGIAYLGIVSSVVAFFCLNFALSRLQSSVVGTFINLTPAITVFAGVAFNGDKLGWLQCAGAALILLGIWGAARKKAEGLESLPAQAE